jgi:hypothetical protein
MSDSESMDLHQKATLRSLNRLRKRRVSDLQLLKLGLAQVLRRTLPGTIYDIPPDEAAVILELERRGN